MKIIFWSEFPAKVNWKKAKALFSKLKLRAEIFVASTSLQDYQKWKKKIESNELTVGAWPILSLKDGYWFSGFTSKRNIDKLNAFVGEKIKIDLEPPFPTWKYSNAKMLSYIANLSFKKAPNSEYLEKTITKLSKKSKVLINEFPLNRTAMEQAGATYGKKNKNVEKNYMLYSTIQGDTLRSLANLFLRNRAKKIFAKDKNASFSVGLIGPGILKTEGSYKNKTQLKQDLKFVKKLGVKKVAIYSIDTLMSKKNAQEWLKVISEFS